MGTNEQNNNILGELATDDIRLYIKEKYPFCIYDTMSVAIQVIRPE